MKRLDLKGQKFGKLTVIEFSHMDKYGKSHHKCACDCGGETVSTGSDLMSGSSKSCGCVQIEKSKARRIDLIGQRFGRFTVIEFSHVDSRRQLHWKCICDCGKTTTTIGGTLKNGTTKSCGCLRAEKAKGNTYTRKPKGVSGFNCKVYAYKKSAKKRGIIWELTDEDCRELFEGDCDYCGVKPQQISTSSRNDSMTEEGIENSKYVHNGIDRVDSSEGYAINNTVSCCVICNYMKRSMSKTDFFIHIEQILNNQLSKVINV